MYFYYEKEIPFSTLENEAVELELLLAKGYAEFIDIGIPKGTQRLAKCRLYYNTFQLVPFNRDMWFTGEDVTLRIPLEIDLDEPPFTFRVLGMNLDDTFSHTFSFGVSIDTGQRISANALDTLQSLVQAPQEG